LILVIFREILLIAIAVFFQYVLLERRFSRAKTLTILVAGIVIVFLANIAVALSTSFLLYKKLYPLTVNLPVFLLFYLVSKHRGFRLLFNLLTGIFLCYITAMVGYFLSILFQYSTAASIIGQLAAFPLVLLFILKVFRPLYMLMLDKLKMGWALICVLPFLSYMNLYILTYYPVTLAERPVSAYPMALTIIFTMAVYWVICIFFRQIQQQYALQNEQQLLKAQVTALQNQTAAVREMEERTRILRHDMRHYLQNISSLLQRGEAQSASEFIGRFDDLLEQSAVPQYCENPTINAILAYHLESAKKEGIDVKTRLDIPVKTPVDEMELSAVLANAIENARNACRRMPEGAMKSLEIICVSKPHFVLETANTYCGEVLFDKDGLPASTEEEHGIGTQSIAAFVKKHNAILDYQTDNVMFRLRILLI
jgi:two-component system, LytTR family, sensor histidine kinase AgrC